MLKVKFPAEACWATSATNLTLSSNPTIILEMGSTALARSRENRCWVIGRTQQQAFHRMGPAWPLQIRPRKKGTFPRINDRRASAGLDRHARGRGDDQECYSADSCLLDQAALLTLVSTLSTSKAASTLRAWWM